MITQRKLNSSAPKPGMVDQTATNISRDGAAKNIVEAPPAHGMKSQSRSDGVHPHLHGEAQNDSVPVKTYDASKPVPVHPGMTDRQRAEHAAGPPANAILKEAGTLGRK
jgi:hypothetical protein